MRDVVEKVKQAIDGFGYSDMPEARSKAAIRATLNSLQHNVTLNMLQAAFGWREYDWEMDGLDKETEDTVQMFNGVFRAMLSQAIKELDEDK